MKSTFRLCGLFLVLLLPVAYAQFAGPKIAKVEIKHVGPPAVSDELIRANIRIKAGDTFPTIIPLTTAVDDDVRNLYSTGFFYNIQVNQTPTPEGIVLTYVVQGKPRLSEIKFHGNKKFNDTKLRKKITSKTGEPLDERKLFTDSQEIQKMYQKSGYPRTTVKAVPSIVEESGRGTVTFEISESPKVKISDVQFSGAKAFPQGKLRKVVKTRRHWMFSWITGHGFLKDEDFEEDRDRLAEFYRDHGYIDFEIKDVQFENPTPGKMIVKFTIYEGAQYKVGAVKISGNKLFTTNEMAKGMTSMHERKRAKGKVGPNGLDMDVGDTFTPKGMGKDVEAVEDFYGAKGYIDVTAASRNLNVARIPNTESGTMDLEFKVEEGQKSYIEKIEIRGNVKTKDKVIRRELAVSPGEPFDMVRVKVSKQRLEGLQYFEKVDARPEPVDPPIAGRKNLIVGVEEKSTGNLTLGAGFSSVDSIVGFAEVSQGNFDLFHPPTFTGGGQKFRLKVAIGTQRQDYLASFVEPWFLGRKLALGVDLYYRDLNFQSEGDLYDEIRAGGRVSLERALWGDFLRGSIAYNPENVGIRLTDNATAYNIPPDIRQQVGYSFLSRARGTLAYDTRGPGPLPNKGQRTEVSGEIVGGPLGGDQNFYKLEMHTGWYFKGFVPGHVLELVGSVGSARAYDNTTDVPFYDRYYLGGLYSLRGYKYRSISPRQPGYGEPVGGDSYWFGSAEYSIPIIERLRVAMFYDIGQVMARPGHYSFSDYNDNWGVGLRLNLPIGPLRLDYGIPITHDQYNGSSGRFQFGVGYTREF